MADPMAASMTCQEADDLAGLYVLDALEPADQALVQAHLDSCPGAHAAFSEVGEVVPALASLIEPVDAPAALKARVLAAIATPARAVPAVSVVPETSAREAIRDEAIPMAAYRRPAWAQWVLAAAAVLVIATLGSWSIVLQERASSAEARAAVLAQALTAMADPTAQVATLRGTADVAGARGFAAFPKSGPGYIVIVGLQPAPSGKTYQAWYLVNGVPTSAGLMSVGQDGYAVLSGITEVDGTNLIALTVERAGGASQPSGAPIVSGQVTA